LTHAFRREPHAAASRGLWFAFRLVRRMLAARHDHRRVPTDLIRAGDEPTPVAMTMTAVLGGHPPRR
jgi:hypothetical protein